ncbi:MAG: M23 family metallopeptidase [Gemmatimonadota bacterium]
MSARWRGMGGTALLGCVLAACAGSAPPPRDTVPALAELPPPLPPNGPFGTHVLAAVRAADASLWVGTYGHGIYRLLPRDSVWTHMDADAEDEGSISWGFVNSIAIGADSTVWYGTVGNGFGRSLDGGRSWRNWTFSELGPAWQYVAPDGIELRGDTVYVATADGLRISWDGGERWRCVVGPGTYAGGARENDGCAEHIPGLPTEYLLALEVGPDGAIWAGHLEGLSVSRDAGRTWENAVGGDFEGGRVRALAVTQDSALWVATEEDIFVDSAGSGTFTRRDLEIPGWDGLPGRPRAIVPSPGALPPSVATSYGLAAATSSARAYRLLYIAAADRWRPRADMWAVAWYGPPLWPIGASSGGLNRVLGGEETPVPLGSVGAAEPPRAPARTWLGRPVATAPGHNPYIDGTYRYGSTMGGNFQQHQGVEFNNPAGTPVHAVAGGTVVFSGPAEAGANTVVVRHDTRADGAWVFSAYYHNTTLEVALGERVRAGDLLARVGNTGRATNDHLHFEVHVAPDTAVGAVVDPAVRFPPHTVNPELWIEPLPGTGVVAGIVVDAAGDPVAGARVHGLVLPYPEETPFSFAETYQDRAHPDPAYNENFAVGDVPAGEYVLGVEIGDDLVWRRIRVEPGQVTWVEFAPGG